MYVNDFKLARKTENIEPTWETLMEDVDLGEPTSFLDHENLGCTQYQISKGHCGELQRYVRIQEFCWGKGKTTDQSFRETWWKKQYLLGLMTWKVMQKNAWKDIANLQTKRLNNKTKSQHHAWMTINLQMKKMSQWKNCLQFAHKLFWKCLYLARTGRPDILGCVNKLARAVTKWTKSCDKRLARLISHIHHTSEYQQYCYVGNTAQQCRLGLFQDSDFARVLEESKSTSRGILCIFGSRTFVPISWMCKKQTSVSHTVQQKLNLSLLTQVYARMAFPLSILGFGDWRISFRTKQNRWTQERAMGKPVGSCQASDYEKSKSHNEACFTDPQSCSGWVVWHD